MANFVMYKNKKVELTLNPQFMMPYMQQAQKAEFLEIQKIINRVYIQKRKPMRVLDIGVGDGRVPRMLRKTKEWRRKVAAYVGIDNNKKAVEKLKETLVDKKMKFIYFDAVKLSGANETSILKKKYDLIWTTYFTAGNFKPIEIKLKTTKLGIILPYAKSCLNPNKKFIHVFKSAYNLLAENGNLILGSVYVDTDKNRVRQERFYKKCGMEVITSKKDSFTATQEGFWSQRFTKELIYKYFFWVDKKNISFVPLDKENFAQMIIISKT